MPLDASQFLDWMEYYRVEPFGDEWRQTAQQSWLLALALRPKKRITIDNFMPVKEPQTKQQVVANVDSYFRAMKAHGEKYHRKHDSRRKGDGQSVRQ
jgi:hypothetical protein